MRVQLRLCLNLLFALFAVFQTSPKSLATQTEAVLMKFARPADFSLVTMTMTEDLVLWSGGETGSNKECLGIAKAFLAQRTGIPRLSCETFTEVFAAKGVATPHGLALQADSAAARAALGEVQSGATVYRQGSFGVQNTADAQFCSLQNPAGAQGFANKMGMPGGSGSPDWIMGGTVSRGSPVITRPAPGIGTNVGGAMEAVVPKNGVSNLWFHMLD